MSDLEHIKFLIQIRKGVALKRLETVTVGSPVYYQYLGKYETYESLEELIKQLLQGAI